MLLNNLASSGWISFASFFLWFSLLFTEKKRVLEHKAIYIIFFAPPLFLIYKKWQTGLLTFDYIKQSWGWAGVWVESVWTYLYFIYYLSFTIIALYLIFHFGKKVKDRLKQKQARIIFLASLITLILNTVIEVIIPKLNIIRLPFLANIVTLIWVAGLVYAIVKYRLMIVTPHTAAEQIISTMVDSLLLLDRNGAINSVNQALLNMSGYQEKELFGKSLVLFFNEVEWQKILSACQTEKRSIKNIEFNFKTKDGQQIPVLLSSSPIIDEAGEIAGIVCILKEIAELKKAKEVLEKSQQEAISLFQNSPLPGIYHDENGLILNVNKKFTELFGYTLEELKGKNIKEGMIFPDERTAQESEKLTRMSLAGKDIKWETIRKKKDGTLIPVIITVAAIITQGEKRAIVAFYQDISKEKEYLERIVESERKYRHLFQNMPAAYYQTDRVGNLLMINPAGIKLLGFNSLEEVIGKNVALDLYYKPEERVAFLKTLKNNGGKVKDYEVVLKNREGHPIFVSTNSQYYYYESGEIAGVEGVFIDITERKKAEEALRKSQQEFASLFKNNSEALVYMDEHSHIIDINPRFTELFGYTLEEIKGKNINSGIIHPPDKITEGVGLDSKAQTQGYVRFETIRRKKDGTLFPVSISGAPVIINGELKGIIGTFIDITERKELEAKLKTMARTDILTGCFNRRYGLELLTRQMKLSQRNKSPLLIAFLDIDGFKEINDRFGHQEGDEVLQQVSKLFASALREVDIICRLGGDEFLLVFPDTELQEASLIRKRLEKNLIYLNSKIKKNYEIRLSIGFAEYSPSETLSLSELIALADQRMYEEKKKRQNRAIFLGEQSKPKSQI